MYNNIYLNMNIFIYVNITTACLIDSNLCLIVKDNIMQLNPMLIQ